MSTASLEMVISNGFKLLLLLNLFLRATNAECNLPPDWHGSWFHSGFPEPMKIDDRSISAKGECVARDNEDPNMFLFKVREPGYRNACYRCMMIYDKHYNVLQYKESYCEEHMENVGSMENLCNAIAGDAPLYTMFRKNGPLVKCPFKGPFSFSYTKGARGQLCETPSSYMDTCRDNRKLSLRYQACLDVEGSEIANEELSCLASWKEGSSRYLVAMVNDRFIHNDESRYRCYVYQRHRDQNSNQSVFKMAQSEKASCVGLWSVEEGVKTFRMEKIERKGRQCVFPNWLGLHHDWKSIEANGGRNIKIHVNKNLHSLKIVTKSNANDLHTNLIDSPMDVVIESHAICHEVKQSNPNVAKVVAHVKADCDSGYVCMVFYYRDQHVIQMKMGGKSKHPSEACSRYFFDEDSAPLTTFVSNTRQNTRPCPFSGRYSLQGSKMALMQLLGTDNDFLSTSDDRFDSECPSLEVVMQAGCSSDSANLQIESTCQSSHRRNSNHYFNSRGTSDVIMNDAPVRQDPSRMKSGFTCHGKWREEIASDPAPPQQDENVDISRGGANSLFLRAAPIQPPVERHYLVLSAGPVLLEDNSVSRDYLCLAYTERDGVKTARASRNSCDFSSSDTGSGNSLTFNITSSGPCTQALTGGAADDDNNMSRLCMILISWIIRSALNGRH